MYPAALPSQGKRPRQQCADAVLMVRPHSFGYNPETAQTNSFQERPAEEARSAAALACQEFEQLLRALASEGVTVCAVEDSAVPPKPDAIFPNNWVSFHEDGTLVLYPLQSASRRRERRPELVEKAVQELGFRLSHLIDLSWYEERGKYLEGTGSLVLDNVTRVAYACISPRTHPDLVTEWAQALGYEAVVFSAADRAGVPLYHTNVLMWIGARAVVVGAAAIAAGDRARVLEHLARGGREIIEIGHDEIARFAGNMLELGTWDEALGDARVLVMSESARRALSPEAFARLSGSTDTVLAVPVPTIERLGGGSVRCMLAEVFRTA
ncbi:MAG: amidinotransferase [Gammaproteobacteria bacterium]|nr:amidinotransferase [Gammaproteobacteria bacterium]